MKVYTHEDVLKLMNRIQVYEINRDLCMLKLTPIDIEEKLLEYWNGGIKSTEEGGKSFDQYHNEHNEDKLEEIISKAHTKITKGKEYATTSNEIQKEINATSSQTEISDEEIEKRVKEVGAMGEYYKMGYRDAIKWYREQLKSKQ